MEVQRSSQRALFRDRDACGALAVALAVAVALDRELRALGVASLWQPLRVTHDEVTTQVSTRNRMPPANPCRSQP